MINIEPSSGTLVTGASDDLIEISGELSEEFNAYVYIFWILWLVLIALCVYGFYYLNNNWLNN